MTTPRERHAPNVNAMTVEQVAAALPEQVRLQLHGKRIVVFRVPDDASDTPAFSAKFGIELDDCANTIVVRYKKEGAERFAAIVTLGSRRIDVNGAVKRELGAQRISFASREVATGSSGMEYGGITAFGLPASWTVLVDESVMAREQIVMGAGIREAKLLLSPQELLALSDMRVAAIAV